MLTVQHETVIASVSGQLSETFRLLIKSEPIFIKQASDLHHSIAHCLVSLETKFQFRDAFRCKITAKILEHVIGNYQTARQIIGQLYFPVDS